LIFKPVNFLIMLVNWIIEILILIQDDDRNDGKIWDPYED